MSGYGMESIAPALDEPYDRRGFFGNRVAKLELVEQLTLVTLRTAHRIDLAEIRVNTTESWFADCLN
jgi:hypothetical protein